MFNSLCLVKNCTCLIFFLDHSKMLFTLQEKEYKEALEAFTEKNKEKAQLVTKLMEVIFMLLVPLHTKYRYILKENACEIMMSSLRVSSAKRRGGWEASSVWNVINLQAFFCYLWYHYFLCKNLQMVSESERVRMKKLEELSKNIDSLHWILSKATSWLYNTVVEMFVGFRCICWIVYFLVSPSEVVVLFSLSSPMTLIPLEFDPDFLRWTLPCFQIFRFVFYCNKVVK